MARLSRQAMPGLPHYLVQNSRAGEKMFPQVSDREFMLKLLSELSRELHLRVHAFSLTSTQLRLIATPADAHGLSALMQSVGRRFVPYINRQHGRHGALWAGRYLSSVVQPDQFLLPAMIHVESMAASEEAARAETCPWSSYPHNAGVTPGKLISPHDSYWALGNTPFDREQKYRQLFADGMPLATQNVIERSLTSGYAIGIESFAKMLEAKTGRRMIPGQPGRPRAAPKQGS